ncbi:pentraxin fusion protein-like [Clarias gariepinus]|uniref:pentraxin fusion protein-like n=1 Tax=Clarias gariepinus TaxID=13013 RepID=UPI00234D9165|nr:pentraxin fusion protein-like [Clarias gariepinus]
MKLAIITLLLLLPPAYNSKKFFFPETSDTSFVRLTPKKPLNLQAFTLCMRISTELDNQRETILFAYRAQYFDELNVWQENGKFTLYLRSSSDGALFSLPSLSSVPTHLCVTWNSSTGATAFWMNGNSSVQTIYRQGQSVNPAGAIILGQDPDSYLGDFNIYQSFLGNITDVHMWDSVLSAGQIEQLYKKQNNSLSGNVLDWNSLVYKIYGNVINVSADV